VLSETRDVEQVNGVVQDVDRHSVEAPAESRRLDTSSVVRAAGRHTGWALLTAGVALLVLSPLLQLQWRAFSHPAETWRKLRAIPNLGDTIRNTIILGLTSVTIAVVLGTVLARSITQLPPRWRKVFALVPLMPSIIPIAAYVVGWTFLLTPRQGYINQLLRELPMWDHLQEGPFDVYSMPAIALITGFAIVPFVYIFMYTSMLRVSGQYEAAAAVCGASRRRRFFTIVLPLLRPAFVYATGISLLLGLGQFAVPLLLGRKRGINVITTEMFRVKEFFPIDYGLGAMLGFPLLVLGLAIVVSQRRVIGDEQRFSVQGGFGSQLVIDKVRWVVLPLVVFTVVGVLLPILAVIHVAFSPYWRGEMTLSGLTTRHVQALFDDATVNDAVFTSLRLTAYAVAILLPLGFAVALGILKRTGVAAPMRNSLDLLATLPLGIPAVLMGLGVLFTYSQPPFRLYGSETVVVIVYVTIMLPFVTRLTLASLQSTGASYVEASRVAGAGGLRTLLRVVVPLTRASIGGAAALVIVLLFHEFSASLMVRGARTHTMGTLLNEYWEFGNLSLVAVLALVMIVSTLVGVAFALLLGGRGALERQ
jgi:iron(III) transport system permease protein